MKKLLVGVLALVSILTLAGCSKTSYYLKGVNEPIVVYLDQEMTEDIILHGIILTTAQYEEVAGEYVLNIREKDMKGITDSFVEKKELTIEVTVEGKMKNSKGALKAISIANKKIVVSLKNTPVKG